VNKREARKLARAIVAHWIDSMDHDLNEDLDGMEREPISERDQGKVQGAIGEIRASLARGLGAA